MSCLVRVQAADWRGNCGFMTEATVGRGSRRRRSSRISASGAVIVAAELQPRQLEQGGSFPRRCFAWSA